MTAGAPSRSDGRTQLPARVAAALALAKIPPSKLGAARHARLSSAERELYLWILHRFAHSGRPSGTEVRNEARRLGLDAEGALATLAREDLVHLDSDAEVATAYPFSGRPTAHCVRFASGHEAYAMCALDALGIAPMFDQTVEISSRDPLTQKELTITLDPDGSGMWQPHEPVVISGAAGDGDSCRSCCPGLNFFTSTASAQRWLANHPDVRGRVISIQEAIVAGRAVFGEVLKED